MNSRAHDINYLQLFKLSHIEENLGTLRTLVHVIDIYFTNMDQDEVGDRCLFIRFPHINKYTWGDTNMVRQHSIIFFRINYGSNVLIIDSQYLFCIRKHGSS